LDDGYYTAAWRGVWSYDGTDDDGVRQAGAGRFILTFDPADAGIGDERQNNPGRTGGWEHAWFSCWYVVRCGGLHGKICVVQERTSQLTRGLGWRDGVGI